MRFLPLLFLVLALGGAHAAPLERDLGNGLIYYRSPNVPGDLPVTTPAARRCYVLDLRYAQGTAAAPAALATWLKSHATSRTPVFILANGDTSPVLLAFLARHDPSSGILTLGATADGFVPDIALKISPEAERRAYDALEKGTDTDSLLRENAAKVRNDEARLSREHLPDSAVEDSPPDNNTPSTDKNLPPKPVPPVDAALQRAVHLHRALLALKKI
jgi:hypothetical protein